MVRDDYQSLHVEQREDGVVVVRIRDRQPGQAANRGLHSELGDVWRDLAADRGARVGLLTGEGASFMPSVDPQTQAADAGSSAIAVGLVKEALAIVHNMIDCDKPIVSAVTGAASGAGLAAALLADVSVVGRNADLRDSHLRFGLPAGDHAAIIWPLLCGLAKTKYHVLTSRTLNGEEAERIGLVSLTVDDDDVHSTAADIAAALAAGPQLATRWTKRALNHWIRQAIPIFEASLAFEALASFGTEHTEALDALTHDRLPLFDAEVAW